jgi:hypothetical protein
VVLLNKMDNAPAMLKLCREIDQLESDADRVMRTRDDQAVPRQQATCAS